MGKAVVLFLALLVGVVAPKGARSDEPLDPEEWRDIPTRRNTPAHSCFSKSSALWNLGRVLRKRWAVLSVAYREKDTMIQKTVYGEIFAKNRDEILVRAADGTVQKILKSTIDPWEARSLASEPDLMKEYVKTFKPKTEIRFTGGKAIQGVFSHADEQGIHFYNPAGMRMHIPYKVLARRGIASYSAPGEMVRDYIKETYKPGARLSFTVRHQTNKGIEEAVSEGRIAGIEEGELWLETPDGVDMGFSYDTIVPGTIRTR